MDEESFELIVKLTRCGKAVRGYFDYRLGDQGITLTQWELLMHLKRSESQELRQADLAKLMSADKGAIVKLVDRLERDGWVKRKENNDDLRSNIVALTTRLKKDSMAVEKVLSSSTQSLVTELSRSEIKTMANGIKEILKAAKVEGQS